MTTIQKRLTQSPEVLRLGACSLDCTHPNACAFAVINGVVVAMTQRRAHIWIFNALRTVAESSAATQIEREQLLKGGAKAVYEDFGVSFSPRLPSTADLGWFIEKSERRLGQMRALTLAGRAWSGIAVDGSVSNVLSWWVPRAQVSRATLALVCHALRLSGPCLVEFKDSKTPEPWRA